MLKVIELFAGTGSQTQALKNKGIPHEVVAISEIDKYALTSYEALHGKPNNMGDIRNIQELPTADLWTYSFPCQDISVAGKGGGLDKDGGTRSGLLWEVERLLKQAEYNGTKPKYLLLENVKNLLGTKHKANFEKWLAFLSSLGYTNYYKILNAKHYGVPQNRERLFCVSILGEHKPFEFDMGRPLELRLFDLLEAEVDERYYLTDASLIRILNSTFNQEKTRIIQGDIAPCILARDYKDPKCVQVGKVAGGKWDKMHDISRRVYSIDGIAPTIHCAGGGNTEAKIAVTDDQLRFIGFYKKRMQGNRIYDSAGVSATITAKGGSLGGSGGGLYKEVAVYDDYNSRLRADSDTIGTLTTDIGVSAIRNGYKLIEHTHSGKESGVVRIRKLTPRECLRLMGWTDEQIDRIQKAGISNSQQYKQAGNGIVIQVLEAIFSRLFLCA
jgi:DNA (cytosine-5)-methyltransferase 1